MSVSPAPLRRRGRSKRANDPGPTLPVPKEDEIQLESQLEGPIGLGDDQEKVHKVEIEEEMGSNVNPNSDQEKVIVAEVRKEIPNGEINVVPRTSKVAEKEEIRNRKRRSVRLETKGEVPDVPADKVISKFYSKERIILENPIAFSHHRVFLHSLERECKIGKTSQKRNLISNLPRL